MSNTNKIESFFIAQKKYQNPEISAKLEAQLAQEFLAQALSLAQIERLQPASSFIGPPTTQQRLRRDERNALAQAGRDLYLALYPNLANTPIAENPIYNTYWNYLKSLVGTGEVYITPRTDAILVNFARCHKYSVQQNQQLHDEGESLVMNKKNHFEQGLMLFFILGDDDSYRDTMSQLEKDQTDRNQTIEVLVQSACGLGVQVDDLLKLTEISDQKPRQTENVRIIDGNQFSGASARFLKDYTTNKNFNFWNSFGIGIPSEQIPTIQSWNEGE